MIKIDEELIKKVANLAKLNLEEKEIKKFTNDFKDILSAFKVLDEVDTKNVKSSFRPFEEKNMSRKDEIQKSITHEEALKFTKNKEKGFFIGPKTVE